MKDTPQSDQNCFILFSCEGGPKIKCKPWITSITPLTLTASTYNDGIMSIEIVNNNFGITTLVPKQNSSGVWSVTATTAGDEELGIEPDTVTFNYEVAVYGNDRPYLAQHYYRYEYEENVDLTVSPIYAAEDADDKSCVSEALLTKDSILTDIYGYESGIAVGAVVNERGGQVAVTMKGKAIRPGVYSISITGTSHYLTVGHKSFVDGANTECAIIEIMMPKYSAGDLVVLFETPIAQTTGRLEVTASKIVDTWLTQHLIGAFTGLSRTHSINQDVSSFIFELDSENKIWKLLGRRYMSDAGSIPDYTLLATAPNVKFMDIDPELPPKCGWTNGIILSGDIRYFVKNFGFFSIAGTHEAYGEYYQQETAYHPQWPGWTRPDEYVHNQGRFLFQYLDKFYIAADQPFEVHVETSKYAAIPYTPPRKGDLSAVINGVALNVNNDSGLKIIVNNVAVGVWPSYVYKRQLGHADGIDTVTRKFGYTATQVISNTTKSQSNSVEMWSDPTYLPRYQSTSSTKYTLNSAAGGNDILVDHCISLSDIIDAIEGSFAISGSSSMTNEQSSEYVYDYKYNGVFCQSYASKNTLTDSASSTSMSGGGRISIAMGSGRKYDTGDSAICTASSFKASASGAASGTRKQDIDNWGWIPQSVGDPVYGHDDAHSWHTTESYDTTLGFGFDLLGCGTFWSDFNDYITSHSSTVVNGSGHLKITKQYREWTENGGRDIENSSKEISVTHSRTKYTTAGHTVYEIGKTKIVTITDGVTDIVENDDPTGTAYASAMAGLEDAYVAPANDWKFGYNSVDFATSETTTTIHIG